VLAWRVIAKENIKKAHLEFDNSERPADFQHSRIVEA